MPSFEELWNAYKILKDKRNESAASDPAAGNTIGPDKDFEYRQVQSLVLGHPDSFDKVQCWMVDVHGSAKCCELEELSEKDVEDAVASAMVGNHNYMDKHGPLAQNVKKVMSQFRLTDSGGGDGSWHLGCHCTEAEAQNLIYKLHLEFGKAIKAGLIHVDRHFWSLELKGT